MDRGSIFEYQKEMVSSNFRWNWWLCRFSYFFLSFNAFRVRSINNSTVIIPCIDFSMWIYGFGMWMILWWSSEIPACHWIIIDESINLHCSDHKSNWFNMNSLADERINTGICRIQFQSCTFEDLYLKTESSLFNWNETDPIWTSA